MTRNHRDRHHAGENDGGRSDLPALAIDALPGIWSTWMQFGFDMTQRWTSLVQPWWQLPDLRSRRSAFGRREAADRGSCARPAAEIDRADVEREPVARRDPATRAIQIVRNLAGECDQARWKLVDGLVYLAFGAVRRIRGAPGNGQRHASPARGRARQLRA